MNAEGILLKQRDRRQLFKNDLGVRSVVWLDCTIGGCICIFIILFIHQQQILLVRDALHWTVVALRVNCNIGG